MKTKKSKDTKCDGKRPECMNIENINYCGEGIFTI
jgi:hypothetical protein